MADKPETRLPGSPAINAGSNTLAQTAGETTDERGATRIANGTADIGAEVRPSTRTPRIRPPAPAPAALGTWDTSTANWFNGTADVAWNNTFYRSKFFAGTAGIT